jgi:hypothetical protein
MAVKLEAWERRHPERLGVLVDWAATHPYETLGAFYFTRPGWQDLDRIAAEDRAGMKGFLEWMRSAPDAARELAMHDEGLAYADGRWGNDAAVDSSALATAHHAHKATPAQGTDLGLQDAGAPRTLHAADVAGVTPPPAKPTEPSAPAEKAPTPKPVYPY